MHALLLGFAYLSSHKLVGWSTGHDGQSATFGIDYTDSNSPSSHPIPDNHVEQLSYSGQRTKLMSKTHADTGQLK